MSHLDPPYQSPSSPDLLLKMERVASCETFEYRGYGLLAVTEV